MANSTNDDDLCLQYGNFMGDLERPAAEATYWVSFFLVLFTLFGASWRFGRLMERIEALGAGDPERRARIYKCFWLAIVAGFFSTSITILECFVLLALQFCDQEPLASLYWSTWTVMQVGGVVAIWGIVLHTRHMMKGRRNPPWALALGTPVLVVAGLGHYFQGKLRRSTRRLAEASRSRSRHSRGRRRNKDEPLSEAPASTRGESTETENRAPLVSDGEDTRTIYGDSSDNFNARIISYTKEGDVILRISPELAKELRKDKTQPSIKWDLPALSQTPTLLSSTSMEQTQGDVTEAEAGTPRKGRPMPRPGHHRSSSSVTFKGMVKVATLEQRGGLAPPTQHGSSSSSTNHTSSGNPPAEPPRPDGPPGALLTPPDARGPAQPRAGSDARPLSPVHSLQSADDALRRRSTEPATGASPEWSPADRLPASRGEAQEADPAKKGASARGDQTEDD